jgi:hypothetical protein
VFEDVAMVGVEAGEGGEGDLDADFLAGEDEDGILPAIVVKAFVELSFGDA